MPKLKIYVYDKCSTCKKATRFLDQKKIAYEALPIVDQPPSKAELKTMLKFLNGDIRKLFNTSGQLYRELKIKDRIGVMTESEALALLSTHGKLVKRPFLLGKDFGSAGFNESEWKSELS